MAGRLKESSSTLRRGTANVGDDAPASPLLYWDAMGVALIPLSELNPAFWWSGKNSEFYG